MPVARSRRNTAARRCSVCPHGKTDAELADAGIAAFRDFIKASGVPTTLGEKGVTEADISGIIEGVRTVSFNADGVLASNPPVTAEALAEILKLAL